MLTTLLETRPDTPLLDQINDPADLRELDLSQLKQVADQLRQYLVYAAGQSGGHFGANLGVVELTVALHYVLNTPSDRLVWDVGHQAYAHKALTGRREQLLHIRSKNGPAAFPVRSESVYDTFGVGHSSTSVSAALGMALAAKRLGQNKQVAAVIGDGAMTAGMAFEAMNDAVAQDADLLIVLNDNDMSISSATGGFAEHLASLWAQGLQYEVGADGMPKLQKRPQMNFKRDTKRSLDDNLFKAIGFHYYGPFDGHDLTGLVERFERVAKVKGPKLIHVYTQKGKGFLPAEQDPIGFHAIGKISSASSDSAVASAMKYSDVFGEFLLDTAAKPASGNQLMAITPAMCEGSGMRRFSEVYPEQFIDVAICEQHAVTLAAGMATEGVKPVVAIYSTFLQRGFDQLVHDVALQNLDVTFGVDRAGLVGEDGPTHAGVYDIGFMRALPNMVVATPSDEHECYQLLRSCYAHAGPAAVRYPRGTGVGAPINKDEPLPLIGKAQVVYSPNNPCAAVLCFGPLLHEALKAAHRLERSGLSLTVVDMRFVKPLDQALLKSVCHLPLITLEEHVVMTGAGSAVNEWLQANGQLTAVLNLGLQDAVVEHGSHAEQLFDTGLDAAHLEQRLGDWLSKITSPKQTKVN